MKLKFDFHAIKIPYTIILGGTDINEYIHNHEQKKVMEEALENSWRIVSFHQDQAHKCIQIWPRFESKIECILPSVIIECDPLFSLFHILQIPPTSRIFLLPASLR